jgi:hypothetical protein
MTMLALDTRRLTTRHFSFVPRPNTERVIGAAPRPNPLDDFSGDNWAARLFVGFNVGDTPTWDLDDLMAIAQDIRKQQGQRPDASYITTKGVFTHKSGLMVEEDGAQVIVFAVDEAPKQFVENMGVVAETVVNAFGQEEVFLEIQKNGIQVKLLRARP